MEYILLQAPAGLQIASMILAMVVCVILVMYLFYLRNQERLKSTDRKDVIQSVQEVAKALSWKSFKGDPSPMDETVETFLKKHETDEFRAFRYRGNYIFPQIMGLLSEFFDYVSPTNSWYITQNKETEMSEIVLQLKKANKSVYLRIGSLYKPVPDLFEQEIEKEFISEGKVMVAKDISFLVPIEGYDLKEKHIKQAVLSSLVTFKKRTMSPEGYMYYLSINSMGGMTTTEEPIDKLNIVDGKMPVRTEILNYNVMGLAQDVSATVAKILVSEQRPNILITGKPGTGKTTTANRILVDMYRENPGILPLVVDVADLDLILTPKFKGWINNEFCPLHGKRLLIVLDNAVQIIESSRYQETLKSFMDGAQKEHLNLQWMLIADVEISDLPKAFTRKGRTQIKIYNGEFDEPWALQIADTVRKNLAKGLSYDLPGLKTDITEKNISSPGKAVIEQIYNRVLPVGLDEEVKRVLQSMDSEDLTIDGEVELKEEKSSSKKEDLFKNFKPIKIGSD